MTTTLIEEAAKKIPSIPLLVNIISKRVRQLTSGQRPMIDALPHASLGDIALTEVIEGKIGYEEYVEDAD